MKYPITNNPVPHSQRAEINEKILMSVLRGKKDFNNTDIYNKYTGIGGLHGLNRADFDNYHDYAEAKRNIELGQFFTPHEVCRRMVEMAAPAVSDTVLDMCCGIGNFFNHLPNEYNAYGFDIDENAIKVAKRLYPDANITVDDMHFYDPKMKFDVIFGNPPYNLTIEDVKSQHFFTHKAYWLLNPGGLMMLVMPSSYLQSASADRMYINMMNRDFSFIGQTRLDPDTFSHMGVTDYETKIMAFIAKSEHMEPLPYDPEDFISMDKLEQRMKAVREWKKQLRLKLLRERNMLAEGSIETRLKKYKESRDPKLKGKPLKVEQKDVNLNVLFKSMSCHEGVHSFEQTLSKYLYDIKIHKHLRKQYPKAVAFVSKFRNQRPPANCTEERREKWEKHEKITPTEVLNKLRRILKRQYIKPEKRFSLRRTPYGYKLKNLANPFAERISDRYVALNNIIGNQAELPQPSKWTPELKKEYRIAIKNIKKYNRAFKKETQQFADMQRDPALESYINNLSFVGMKQSECQFNEPQKQDMGLLYQKRYSLLNWQQGSGKTAVLYHFGKYHMDNKRVKNVFVVAPSIAIHMTWSHFLRYNGVPFTVVSKPEHFDNLEEGKFVILSVSMLGKIDDALRKYLKMKSQKVCLLFDESDELTSDLSLRTKRTLKCFRRVKYKMLGTGTTTRNYISELFSQFQLLYNSSVYFMCMCPTVYFEDEYRAIKEKVNSYFRKPFPPRRGAVLFKSCFNPGKATVFGIEKQNQDVYNKDALWEIIGRTIITRKFKEFAGDKYTIHSHTVEPGVGELGVYRKVILEFFSIVDMYFNTTGDDRKDSFLAIVRQIQLLIRACSVPSLMPGYTGSSLPQKVRYIENMVRNIQDKVAIGCTSIEALEYYEAHMKKVFPERKLFIIKGDITFGKRKRLLQEFQDTQDGILVCMQQSLKSSVNIPECNEVILESLQWNIPRMEQFYFRFIRFDSEGNTNVHFVNYSDSIEQNIMALILTKERLNDFIQTGEVTEESAVFDEFGVSPTVIDSLFTRTQDEEGKFHIAWGEQKVVA